MSSAVVNFTAVDFAKGFVASLVLSGESSLQPKSPAYRHGLYRVWQYLADEAKKAEAEEARDWFKTIVRLRNRVSPGSTGAFDQFQTDLRDLQLSLTESPNPSYEDISFSVTEPFAESLLEQLGERRRALVDMAVSVFLRGDQSMDVAAAH